MGISRKLQKNTQATTKSGAIPLNYKYTMGVAGEQFFQTLMKKGQYLAGECPECGFVYFPARMFCERCFGRIEKFHNVGNMGTLMSFTVSFEDFKGNPLSEPEYFGLIQMHGTDTVIVHRLNGKDADTICIGAEVKAVLAPKSKRKGGINDILRFDLV